MFNLRTFVTKHISCRKWTRQEIENVCRDINANSDFEVRIYDKKVRAKKSASYPVLSE